MSFPRRSCPREDGGGSPGKGTWIPACAGMTDRYRDTELNNILNNISGTRTSCVQPSFLASLGAVFHRIITVIKCAAFYIISDVSKSFSQAATTPNSPDTELGKGFIAGTNSHVTRIKHPGVLLFFNWTPYGGACRHRA